MTAPNDRTMVGIGLGVLAYSVFALHDASNKWLVATLPVWQVLFFRSATIVVGSLAVGRTALLARLVATPLKLPMLLRSLVTLTAWLCFYTAARDLPLAQLLTLYFSAPLMTTLLAIPLLGEQVTTARGISVMVGFAGVLVASDPLGVRASWPTALVLLAAALWGFAIVLMRQISRRESSLVQMVYMNASFLVVTGTATAFTWTTPTGFDPVLLLAVGVLGGLGQFALFEAARFAPAAVMATVEYSSLVWAFVLGYLVWGDIPSFGVFAGAALIMLAGLFLVIMERRASRAARL